MTHDPLTKFEKLTLALREAPFAINEPPAIHVAPRVMARIRSRLQTAETPYDWTLAFMAAASCIAALLVVAVGLSWIADTGNSLEALFQIVPPIGL